MFYIVTSYMNSNLLLDSVLCRYNLIGNVKFCLTLLADLAIFNERLSQMQIVGVALAFCGRFINTVVTA